MTGLNPSLSSDTLTRIAPPARQNNNFDALRLIAALMVLVSHQFALSGRAEPIALGLYTFGTLGVVVFFSISGFLVASSWIRDPRLVQFTTRRLLRIWPALMVNVVCLAVAATLIQPENWHEAFAFVRHNLVFVRHGGAYFTTNPIGLLNGPLWTIPIEFFCYMLFAALAIGSRKYLSHFIAALLLIAATYLFAQTEPKIKELAKHMGDPTYKPWLCSLFLAGALLQVSKTIRTHAAWFGLIGIAMTALGYVTAGLLICAPPILIMFGEKSWPVLRQCARFGDLSYGVYLWAWPVQQTVIYLLGTQSAVVTQLIISTFFTLLLAYASWHSVEKWAILRKPSAPSTPSATQLA